MRIDTHHHLWTLARGDYHWLTPELDAIYRDFTPADLAPHLSAAGIDKTVLVQAAESLAETEFLLEYAAATDWIGGVVGWIDMEAQDAVPVLERLAAQPKFCGIRPMIQSLADDEWIVRAQLDPVFDALVAHGLTFDALVLPRHLPWLLRRMERHPDLRCVIDHGAKPQLATGQIAQWRTNIAHLARNCACSCKLSGLLTEAGPAPGLAHIRPAAEHLLEVFGPGRLMFGSDWPVINLAGDYGAWVEMVETLLAPLPPAAREQVWAGTAGQFYGLNPV